LVLEGFLLAGEGGLVDGQALAAGGGRDVFFGGVGLFVEVFGFCGGEDFEVGEADLGVEEGLGGFVLIWAVSYGVLLTCASRALRRGEALARITRLDRRCERMGSSSGKGPFLIGALWRRGMPWARAAVM
jgi:hypothetical protein